MECIKFAFATYCFLQLLLFAWVIGGFGLRFVYGGGVGGLGGGERRGVGQMSYQARVWDRIPFGEYDVAEHIMDFLDERNVYDCFKYVETDIKSFQEMEDLGGTINYLMRLKCMHNKKLINVNIEVENRGRGRGRGGTEGGHVGVSV